MIKKLFYKMEIIMFNSYVIILNYKYKINLELFLILIIIFKI